MGGFGGLGFRLWRLACVIAENIKLQFLLDLQNDFVGMPITWPTEEHHILARCRFLLSFWFHAFFFLNFKFYLCLLFLLILFVWYSYIISNYILLAFDISAIRKILKSIKGPIYESGTHTHSIHSLYIEPLSFFSSSNVGQIHTWTSAISPFMCELHRFQLPLEFDPLLNISIAPNYCSSHLTSSLEGLMVINQFTICKAQPPQYHDSNPREPIKLACHRLESSPKIFSHRLCYHLLDKSTREPQHLPPSSLPFCTCSLSFDFLL